MREAGSEKWEPSQWAITERNSDASRLSMTKWPACGMNSQLLPDADFVELRGAGHIPMADDPHAVIAAIRQAAGRLATAP